MKDFSKRSRAKARSGDISFREQRNMICENLSFPAAEAYKLLRTNLMFALPEQGLAAENRCRIVGITSALRGEGKSVTSVNLAYTLAETGKNVLLIDGDMRLPSAAKKLGLSNRPGLSNVLAGLNQPQEVMQYPMGLENWSFLCAGDIPPNPSELLGSERMKQLLSQLAGAYDFIVIDLPPVNIVADALAISPWVDGIVLAVREDYSDRQSVAFCMRQLEQIKEKLLGFVLTNVRETGKHYGRYRYGGRYYETGYSSSYASAAQRRRQAAVRTMAAERNHD